MGARKVVPPYQPLWERTQLSLFGSLPCLQEAGAGLGHPLKTYCVTEASGSPLGLRHLLHQAEIMMDRQDPGGTCLGRCEFECVCLRTCGRVHVQRSIR